MWWYTWTSLLLVCCTLVKAEVTAETEAPSTEVPVPVATTRAPPRTLDRQAAELAWKSWLQSPESGNQNAPPRRITTKSLFITPLVCPKGQRLDRNGCVQVVTVNKDEHERILLEQLNALFTSAPSADVIYDYGDDEPGPLQLSIPIGLDPQAAPLQGQEPSGQAQELQLNIKVDKKDENNPNGASGIEAELEILKVQHTHNNTAPSGADLFNNALNLHHADKPKRDSTAVNVSDIESLNNTSPDEGQKELVYGHVNIDPVIYATDHENANTESTENIPTDSPQVVIKINSDPNAKNTFESSKEKLSQNESPIGELKKIGDQSKLNPENDYSDIGEAIKLISRYAEVTTDDNFDKDQKKIASKEDAILGTRTKLQHRRNKPKTDGTDPSENMSAEIVQKIPAHIYPKNTAYYRYPWSSEHGPTPPPDYPFRHLQDYWPGRNKVGGVYNMHENPRRHHHSYPHNFRPHGYPTGYVVLPEAYPEQLRSYIHKVVQHHSNPMRSHTNNQDLYSLLGLRHWFSSEGTSKR